MASTLDRRKVVTFGLLGALGCLAGWTLGEGFLAFALRAVKQEQEAPSLASRPDPVALVPVNQAVPPPPPLPEAPALTAMPPPPPPPLPELRRVSAPPPPPDFKERLDRWGAKTGDVQLSLVWNNANDLDLHCIDPSGEEIYYSHAEAASGGQLDVDKNAGEPFVNDPVENIFWPSGKAPDGRYRVYVNHYAEHGGTDPTAFKVSVLVDNERREFEGSLSSGNDKRLIHEFTLGPALRLAVPTKVVLNPGGKNEMRAMVARSRYTGSVQLRCEGDLRGLSVAEAEVPADQNDSVVQLTAEPTAEAGSREVRLVATAGSARTVEKFLVEVEPLPPVLRISAPSEVLLIPGTSNALRVRVVRLRLPGAVRLRCEGDLKGLSIPDVQVREDQSEAILNVHADSLAEGGTRTVQLIASAADMTAPATFQVKVKAVPPVLRMAAPREVIVRPKSSNAVPVRIARERFHGSVEVRPNGGVEGVALPGIQISEGHEQGELKLTADADAEPGRRTVRLQAASGPFHAEADLAVLVPDPPPLPWLLVLVIGAWTGLLATGLALALAGGQSWYLSKRWLQWRQALTLVGGGMLAGVVAGGLGQFLFSVLARAEVLPQLGFLTGWGLLGALVGRGIGFFVPNLHGGKAALAGALGGLAGAAAFIGVSAIGDAAGRCVGAAILGLCIGLVVAVIEAAFRTVWLEVVYGSREMRTVNLGPEPIRIGANSACTIWTPTAPPVALQFWLRDGRVTREDVPGNRTSTVDAGHRERVGTVEIVVRTGKASSAAPARPPARPAGPPPPPPPSNRTPPLPAAAPTAVPCAPAPASDSGPSPRATDRVSSAPSSHPAAPKRPPPPPPTSRK